MPILAYSLVNCSSKNANGLLQLVNNVFKVVLKVSLQVDASYETTLVQHTRHIVLDS